MKILFHFRSLAIYGGIERIFVEKMNFFSTIYDYDIYMITTDQGDHTIPYKLSEKVHFEDLGIRFHQKYQYHGLKRLWMTMYLMRLYERKMKNHIRLISPDIIVCTTSDPISSIVKLKGNIPLVVESHSICLRTIDNGQSGLFRKLYRYRFIKALSRANVVVALTNGDANEWRKYHHNVVVIPNFVHLNKGIVSNLDNKRVIFVGRFDYQKQPLEMVRIWEKVFMLHPEWQLDIFGEGELQNNLERIIRSRNINAFIHPPTDHIFNYYCSSDILVSTSLFEPFGLVIPEAMSCGLPVVAFDCPYGPADIIENGVSGFIIEEGNLNIFVDKLSILMSDIDLRCKMGRAGFLYSQKFDKKHIMPLWRCLFEQLL